MLWSSVAEALTFERNLSRLSWHWNCLTLTASSLLSLELMFSSSMQCSNVFRSWVWMQKGQLWPGAECSLMLVNDPWWNKLRGLRQECETRPSSQVPPCSLFLRAAAFVGSLRTAKLSGCPCRWSLELMETGCRVRDERTLSLRGKNRSTWQVQPVKCRVSVLFNFTLPMRAVLPVPTLTTHRICSAKCVRYPQGQSIWGRDWTSRKCFFFS